MNAVLLALLFLLLLFGYLFYKLGKAKKGKFPKEYAKAMAFTWKVEATIFENMEDSLGNFPFFAFPSL